ncbi:MAG: Holliday junction branch migration protein RuvA [Lachnospiraceae bacterium]
MIGYIKGTIEDISTDSIVLDHNGIGYLIYTSQMVIGRLVQTKECVKVYTYMHVREDEITLYGFLDKEELNTFKLLLTINGIGPKAALSILSSLSVSDLTYAVMTGDAKAITRANGIGQKGANRIIMELKDKLKIDDVLESEHITTLDVKGGDSISDTVLALVSLGYTEAEAMKAIKQVDGAKDMGTDELLKLALKRIF